MRRRIVASAAVAAGLFLSGIAVHAYVTYGHVWGVRQVPYYVNPVNMDVSQSAAIAAVQAGAQAWTAQSNADFSFYYAGTTTGTSLVNNGKNEVFFRNEANGSTAATTYWWWGGDGKLMDTDIVFWDGGFTFTTSALPCSSAAYIEDVATHEFGHALGLNHSSDSTATMYPTFSGWCNTGWRSLAPDDIAGVESLYPVLDLPKAPTSLTAAVSTAAPSSAIVLAWVDGSTNEDRFLVERSTSGGSYVQVANLAGGTVTYTDGALTASTTYTYRVRASNASGFSAYTNLASATTAASTAPPSTPSSPSPSNGATGQGTSVTLRWTSTNATSYDVYFGTSSAPALAAQNLATAAWTTPTLSYSTKYYWRVVAKNANGSASGTTWSFTTKATKKGNALK